MTTIQCTPQQPCMVSPDGSVNGGMPLSNTVGVANFIAGMTYTRAEPPRLTDAYVGLDFALHAAGIAAIILATACFLHVTQIHEPFVDWIDNLLNPTSAE